MAATAVVREARPVWRSDLSWPLIPPFNGLRILNLNCWNEWTEGSYLEPDTAHGTAYLDAVKAVFTNAK